MLLLPPHGPPRQLLSLLNQNISRHKEIFLGFQNRPRHAKTPLPSRTCSPQIFASELGPHWPTLRKALQRQPWQRPGQWWVSLVHLIKCLPAMHKSLGSIPSLHRVSMRVHTCNQAGRSGVQGHPGLYRKFQAILGYMRPCLETKATKQSKPKTSPKHTEMRCPTPEQNSSALLSGLARSRWFSRAPHTPSLKCRWEEAGGGLKQPTHEKLYSAQFNN